MYNWTRTIIWKNLPLFASVILFPFDQWRFRSRPSLRSWRFVWRENERRGRESAREQAAHHIFLCLRAHDNQNVQLRRAQLLLFYFNYTRKPGNTIFCSMIIRENSNSYHPWRKNFLRQPRSLRQIPRQLRCGHRISEGTPVLSSPCHQAFGVRLHHNPRRLLLT